MFFVLELKIKKMTNKGLGLCYVIDAKCVSIYFSSFSFFHLLFFIYYCRFFIFKIKTK